MFNIHHLELHEIEGNTQPSTLALYSKKTRYGIYLLCARVVETVEAKPTKEKLCVNTFYVVCLYHKHELYPSL